MNLITNGTMYPSSVPNFLEKPTGEQDLVAEPYYTGET